MWRCTKRCQLNFIKRNRIYVGYEELITDTQDKDLEHLDSRHDEVTEVKEESEPYCGLCGAKVYWEE